MRVSVIFYHKGIKKYKREWLEKCVDSILNQSYNDFSIYELNYGGDGYSLLSDLSISKEFNFYNRYFENHAEGINFLFDIAIKDKVDILFNTNLDDYYHLDRFQIQIEKVKQGYDLVSSNFRIIKELDDHVKEMIMSNLDIKEEFNKGHNIIAHPSVCFSKNFFKKNKYNISDLPEEDFRLWKKTIDKFKFYICDEFLLNYRKHNQQITSVSNEVVEEIQPFYFTNTINFNQQNRCRCGEPINKVKYNFCQKCNIIY
jgi:hypothetical protein